MPLSCPRIFHGSCLPIKFLSTEFKTHRSLAWTYLSGLISLPSHPRISSPLPLASLPPCHKAVAVPPLCLWCWVHWQCLSQPLHVQMQPTLNIHSLTVLSWILFPNISSLFFVFFFFLGLYPWHMELPSHHRNSISSHLEFFWSSHCGSVG